MLGCILSHHFSFLKLYSTNYIELRKNNEYNFYGYIRGMKQNRVISRNLKIFDENEGKMSFPTSGEVYEVYLSWNKSIEECSFLAILNTEAPFCIQFQTEKF